ncbi:TPR-like protein, partial [Neolentinus lepideus HHB14362 ss-1]
IILYSPLLSRTIPAEPPVFLGRDQEIEKSLNILTSQTDPQAHLAVLGPGGMGKTSFALTLLHHSTIKDHFKQHVYFVPCESANSCDQLLFHITSVLGIKKQDGEDILTSMDTFLRTGPKLLVVLDNFETPYDQKGSNQNIVDVLGRISSVPQVSLIVTMRGIIAPSGISHVKTIKLGSLDPEASKQAFLTISQETAAQGALEEFLEEVDHIPLAVMLIANLAKLDSVESLLQEWREKKTILLADGADRLNNIEVSIDLSLKAKAVQDAPDALPLLALISYLPDGIMMAQETLEEKTPHMKARNQALRALRQVALIQEHEGCINVLSPVRHYICKQHPLGQNHRQAIEMYYTALISKYEEDHQTAVNDVLLTETANITFIIQNNCNSGHATLEILTAGYDMSLFLLQNRPTTYLLDMITNSGQQTASTDFTAKCQYLSGQMLLVQSDYAEAALKIQEALQCNQSLGNKQGVAQCLKSIGDILYFEGNHSDAKDKLKDAMVQFQQIGDRLGAAQCLRSIGGSLYIENNYSDAKDRLEDAMGQFQQIGNRLGAAQCLQRIGDILYMEDNYRDAKDKLEDALVQLQQIGNRRGAAQCLHSISNILCMENNYSDAKDKLKDAMVQFQQIGNRLGAAQCLQSIGRILHMENNYNQLKDAVGQFQQIGDRLGAAQCLYRLGRILHLEGSNQEAKEKLEEAWSLYQHMGLSHLQGAVTCHQLLKNVVVIDNEQSASVLA